MKTITDSEFGTIKVVKSARSLRISIKLGTDGQLRISMPPRTPLLLAKKLINDSRPAIRTMVSSHHHANSFTDGMQVGKSHTLVTRPGSSVEVTHHGQQIIVALPHSTPVDSPEVQTAIRPAVTKALRKEAKSYLPRRLGFLAKQHRLAYSKVRFSHASSRWGSCSSSGTISLNIALMRLPFPLIDYVLIHELCHTVEMNHSDAFWTLVGRCDPEYKTHRKTLRDYSPTI